MSIHAFEWHQSNWTVQALRLTIGKCRSMCQSTKVQHFQCSRRSVCCTKHNMLSLIVHMHIPLDALETILVCVCVSLILWLLDLHIRFSNGLFLLLAPMLLMMLLLPAAVQFTIPYANIGMCFVAVSRFI